MAEKPSVLVTGAAGFIGFHMCQRLLADGYLVVGVDSLNDYYDPALKQARLDQLTPHADFTAITGKVETPGLLLDLFATHGFEAVIHLAAQAGVRYSIDNPRAYAEANLMGVFELIEAARAHPPKHMLMASTSSAYGANTQMPYRETDKTSAQMSFYAATKMANEAMSHSYAHLYDLPITMLRFFTVYGPWGRPDMALFKFTKAILNGEAIDVYNGGDMQRDFTYVDDIVEGMRQLMDVPPGTDSVGGYDSLSPVAPHRVVNIGNSKPTQLMDFIRALETALGRKAQCNMMAMQPGDVPATWADTSLLNSLTGYAPSTEVPEGVAAFVGWYRDYFKI
ncbi:NAD-dependent epimerase/dehydratase family protein [Cognatishimia sp. WU-CL00825]|uniref:SDR family NAD(P)-dependent oxidoreductase n=1 Tax=Cognatishimia sp. WU-CL00825 TaxID=3127658 RepID=UPI003104EE4C